MSFTESLKVEIESVFNSRGFNQLSASLGRTMTKLKGMEKMMNRAKGMRNMTGEAQQMQNALDEAGLNFQGVNSSIDDLSNKQIGGMISNIPNADLDLAKDQIREFGGFVTDADGKMVGLGETVRRLGRGYGRLENFQPFRGGLLSDPSEIMGRQGFSPEMFGSAMPDLGTTLGGGLLAEDLGVLQAETGKVNNVTGKSNSVFQRFKGRIKGVSGKIRGDMVPSLQSMQMTLLGVQFQLLSLAFIFGGLMGSALGAVGIFKILGNTLKMFFLPTALDLLPVVLDIRDAILSVDDETKKYIGRVFTIISAFAALGSLLAFTVNGFLSVLTVVKGLASPLIKLGSLLSGFGSGGIIGGISAVGSVIASMLGPITLIIGAAILLWTIFNRFPGLADFLGEAFTTAFAMIADYAELVFNNLVSIVKGVFNIITGIITTVLALLQGDFDKAMKGMKEILFGLGKAIVEPFVNTINFLFQDLLPKFADFGASILKAIVSAFTGNEGIIRQALKSILPRGLFAAVDSFLGLEGINQTAKDLIDESAAAVGDIGKIKVPDIGEDFKSGDESGGKKNVQQNQIFADVTLNDKEETPQETGRRFGSGLSQSLNSRQSNFSGGT